MEKKQRKFRINSMRARLMFVALMVFVALFSTMFYGVARSEGVSIAASWAGVPLESVDQIRQVAKILVGTFFGILLPFWIVGAHFFASRLTQPFVNLSQSTPQIRSISGREEIEISEFDLSETGSAFTSTEEVQKIKRMLDMMYTTLRENDEMFRSIVSSQRELIFRWAPDLRLTFVNQAFCDFFGQSERDLLETPGELQRKAMMEFYPELAQIVQRDILVSLENFEEEIVNETFLTMPDGSTQWVQWRSMAIYGDASEILECQTIGYVLTDLKQAQMKLEDANYQLTALSRELIKSQEEERIKVARYLHDQVLGELGEMARKPDNSLDQDTINQVINKLRTSIYMMRSPMLNYGLSIALEDLADHLREQAAQTGSVNLNYEVEKSLTRFDRQVETQIYRIVQEASKNAFEHANASLIRIFGEIRDDLVDLTISDDGSGFVYDKNNENALPVSRHYGMIGMKERCKIIGAHFDINTRIGQGTTVHIRWTPDMVPTFPENESTRPVRLPEI